MLQALRLVQAHACLFASPIQSFLDQIFWTRGQDPAVPPKRNDSPTVQQKVCYVSRIVHEFFCSGLRAFVFVRPVSPLRTHIEAKIPPSPFSKGVKPDFFKLGSVAHARKAKRLQCPLMEPLRRCFLYIQFFEVMSLFWTRQH